MIEVEAVQPTPREYRPMRKGWGLVHWVCALPNYVFLIGFILFGCVTVALVGDILPDGLLSGFLIGTWLVNLAGGYAARQVVAGETRRSPAGNLPWRWRIDEQGLEFDNGLQVNRVDWRAVKTFREESDRFLFLVTPAYNPVLPSRLLDEGQRQSLRALVTDLTDRGILGAGVD